MVLANPMYVGRQCVCVCVCVCVILTWSWGEGAQCCNSSMQVYAYVLRVRQNHIYTVYGVYTVFWQEITKYTVTYGVYIRFWPTLYMLVS
jgi:hypothetical protein